MATTKTFDLPNGDKATLYPYDGSKIRESLKSLVKQGIHIKMGDTDLLNSIEFQMASCKAVLKSYEEKQPDGTFKDLSDSDRSKFINDRPKVTNWLVKKAQEFAGEVDKEFEEDSKNS
jgi:hypothetical protein